MSHTKFKTLARWSAQFATLSSTTKRYKDTSETKITERARRVRSEAVTRRMTTYFTVDKTLKKPIASFVYDYVRAGRGEEAGDVAVARAAAVIGRH